MTLYYCTGLSPVPPGTNRCCKQLDKVYGAKGDPVLAWAFCRALVWYFWKEKIDDHD